MSKIPKQYKIPSKNKKRFREKRDKKKLPVIISPIYDDIHFKGVDWLDKYILNKPPS